MTATLLSLDALRARIEALAQEVGAGPQMLPTYGRTEDFARPHIEVDDRYHWVVVERGEELERRSTADLDQLLEWVFEAATFELACAHELQHRRAGPDSRRLMFRHQEALMARLDPAWGERLARRHADILGRHPFVDQPGWRIDPPAPDRVSGTVLSVIILSGGSAPDVAALMRDLVPAAVDGLVRDVVVAQVRQGDDLSRLCEAAGAALVSGGIAEAAALARRDLALVAPSDLRLPDMWARRLGEALDRGARKAVVLGEGERGLFAALKSRPYGLVAPREDLLQSADLAALRRRLGAGAVKVG